MDGIEGNIILSPLPRWGAEVENPLVVCPKSKRNTEFSPQSWIQKHPSSSSTVMNVYTHLCLCRCITAPLKLKGQTVLVAVDLFSSCEPCGSTDIMFQHTMSLLVVFLIFVWVAILYQGHSFWDFLSQLWQVRGKLKISLHVWVLVSSTWDPPCVLFWENKNSLQLLPSKVCMCVKYFLP